MSRSRPNSHVLKLTVVGGQLTKRLRSHDGEDKLCNWFCPIQVCALTAQRRRYGKACPQHNSGERAATVRVGGHSLVLNHWGKRLSYFSPGGVDLREARILPRHGGWDKAVLADRGARVQFPARRNPKIGIICSGVYAYKSLLYNILQKYWNNMWTI